MTRFRLCFSRIIRGMIPGMIPGMILTSIGCVDVAGPAPEPISAADVFSEFRFTTDAMLIKPGDTLQLSLMATSMEGSPIPVDPRKVEWQSGDSVRLKIDSVGHITATTPTTNAIAVTAVYTHGTTTRRAPLTVYISSDTISATSLKIVALDSVRVGVGSNAPLPRIRLDLYQGATRVRAGVNLPVVVPLPYRANYLPTGGPNQEPVYTVSNGGAGLGKFWVRASINLYGSEVRDSVEFTGTYPFTGGVLIAFQNDDDGKLTGTVITKRFVQQPCGITRVWNFSPRPLEMVFSDSSASANECVPSLIPESVKTAYSLFPTWVEQVGGNLLMPPYSVVVRRSATRGEITWFVRDPETKQTLPFSGKYSSIYVD